MVDGSLLLLYAMDFATRLFDYNTARGCTGLTSRLARGLHALSRKLCDVLVVSIAGRTGW
jgi:hypothetical protein